MNGGNFEYPRSNSDSIELTKESVDARMVEITRLCDEAVRAGTSVDKMNENKSKIRSMRVAFAADVARKVISRILQSVLPNDLNVKKAAENLDNFVSPENINKVRSAVSQAGLQEDRRILPQVEAARKMKNPVEKSLAITNAGQQRSRISSVGTYLHTALLMLEQTNDNPFGQHQFSIFVQKLLEQLNPAYEAEQQQEAAHPMVEQAQAKPDSTQIIDPLADIPDEDFPIIRSKGKK